MEMTMSGEKVECQINVVLSFWASKFWVKNSAIPGSASQSPETQINAVSHHKIQYLLQCGSLHSSMTPRVIAADHKLLVESPLMETSKGRSQTNMNYFFPEMKMGFQRDQHLCLEKARLQKRKWQFKTSRTRKRKVFQGTYIAVGQNPKEAAKKQWSKKDSLE